MTCKQIELESYRIDVNWSYIEDLTDILSKEYEFNSSNELTGNSISPQINSSEEKKELHNRLISKYLFLL